MKPGKRNIDEILKRGLPSASRDSEEQVEDLGARVLHRLRAILPNGEVATEPLDGDFDSVEGVWSDPHDDAKASRWPRLVAMAAAIAAAVIIPMTLQWSAPGTLETATGARRVEFGDIVRAEGAAGEILVLTDNSRVEMRSGTELRLERAEDGLRIRLNSGAVIVNAAKQRTGHLYVLTKDVTVSVKGTVFLVNAEEEGSSVSVIEGEVRVQQGNVETKLRPGEHVSTTLKPEPRAVKEEIAWSPNAQEHLALLQQEVRLTLTPTIAPITGEITLSVEPQKPRFEEAAIRPCTAEQQREPAPPPGARGGGGVSVRTVHLTPGRFHARCMTVAALIKIAHRPLLDPAPPLLSLLLPSLFPPSDKGFEMGQTYSFGSDGGNDRAMRGGPEWMYVDGYTIEAITDGSTGALTMQREMLWELLERRFQIKTHVETEQIPAFALTIAPGGLKIKPFQDGDCSTEKSDFPSPKPRCGVGFKSGWNGPNVRAEVSQNTLASLTAVLEDLGAAIIDKTGNTDRFTFVFEYGPDESTPRKLRRCQELLQRFPERAPNCADRPTAPPIHTALAQLGLKVEPIKAPREFIVIDRVERPSGN